MIAERHVARVDPRHCDSPDDHRSDHDHRDPTQPARFRRVDRDGDATVPREEVRDVVEPDRVDRIVVARHRPDARDRPGAGRMDAVVVARGEVDDAPSPADVALGLTRVSDELLDAIGAPLHEERARRVDAPRRFEAAVGGAYDRGRIAVDRADAVAEGAREEVIEARPPVPLGTSSSETSYAREYTPTTALPTGCGQRRSASHPAARLTPARGKTRRI